MSRRILLLASSVLLFAVSHEVSQETTAIAASQEQKKVQRGRVPASVTVVRDIVYAKYGEREVQLDLYLPKEPARKPMPCVVVIHGGGWRSGDKQRFAPIAARLAENGFAAVCIGYRLLPEVSFPAPVEDCKAAVRWVRANATKHDIDPDRIGAIGGSAGAHLAAMLATSHKAADLEGRGGNPGVSSRIQATVAMATPADMTQFAQRSSIGDELAKLISPLTHVDADSASILLIHSNADKTVPFEQSERLQAKYKEAGVRAELVTIDGAPHAFWNSPQWFDDTLANAVKFFNDTLNSAKSQSQRQRQQSGDVDNKR